MTSVRRLRNSALVGATGRATNYGPDWWRRYVFSGDSHTLFGFDARDGSVFASVDLGDTIKAACIAPETPGSRASFPYAPGAVPFYLYVICGNRILVRDRLTLAAVSEITQIPSPSAQWIAAGKHGLLFPGYEPASVVYFDQSANRRLDKRFLPISEAHRCCWVYNESVDLFAVLGGHGRGVLVTYDATRGLAMPPAGAFTTLARTAAVDDIRFRPIGPDAYVWYEAPTQLASFTGGPQGFGQRDVLDISSDLEVTLSQSDLTYDEFQMIDSAGGPTARVGTRLDAGLFPELPWFVPLDNLAVSDPGLDRNSAGVFVSSGIGEAYTISTAPDPVAGFRLFTWPQGQYTTTATAGQTVFDTQIPWDDSWTANPHTGSSMTVSVLVGTTDDRPVVSASNNGGKVRVTIGGAALAGGETVTIYGGFVGVYVDPSTSQTSYTFRLVSEAGVWATLTTAGQTVLTTDIPWQDWFTGPSSTPAWQTPSISVIKNGTAVASYTVAEAGGLLQVTLGSGAAAGDRIQVNVSAVHSRYTVPGTGSKTVRMRLRGFYERRSYTPSQVVQVIQALFGEPSDAWKLVELDPAAMTDSVTDHFIAVIGSKVYLLNGRRDPVSYGATDPLFSGFDYVFELPADGGDTIEFIYDLRSRYDGGMASIMVVSPEYWLPADDDPGNPLLRFEPDAPLSGTAGQVDILEVRDS